MSSEQNQLRERVAFARSDQVTIPGNANLMKRPFRFAMVLAVALGFAPFLPLYVERTMLRSWLMNSPGTVIEWGWKICTLKSFWEDYSYLRPEQRPALWLSVNLALAVIYAVVIALIVDQFLEGLRERLARHKIVG